MVGLVILSMIDRVVDGLAGERRDEHPKEICYMQ